MQAMTPPQQQAYVMHPFYSMVPPAFPQYGMYPTPPGALRTLSLQLAHSLQALAPRSWAHTQGLCVDFVAALQWCVCVQMASEFIQLLHLARCCLACRHGGWPRRQRARQRWQGGL